MQRAFDTVLSGLLGELFSGRPEVHSGRPGVLLAVSGGIDSMCMAELFRNSSVETDFAVAHCNFSLRGEESDSDEALVTSWAGKTGVVLHKKRFDTQRYALENSLSVEMAARELRYRWFAGLCEEYHYTAVAVAHNANDNVETLFLNLLRGTGIRGLSGMKPVSPLQYLKHPSDSRVMIVRPLLDFTRKQIEGYVFAHKVEYHQDRTNSETEYKRNKIRNLVFPVLEQINPSFVRTVNREMSYFSQVETIADGYCSERCEKIVSVWGDRGARVNVAELMNESGWEYILYRILDRYGFGPAVVSSLSDLLKSGRTVSGKVFHSETFVLVTTGTELIVTDKEPEETTRLRLRRRGTLPDSVCGFPDCHPEVLVVRGPGRYVFNGRSFDVREVSKDELGSLKAPSGILYFDSGVFGFPFMCRKWEKGDWMVPLGMKGKKKVSDLFTDLKYSLLDKARAVVLENCPGKAEPAGRDTSGKRIAGVLGVRSDEATKVTDRTSAVIIVETDDGKRLSDENGF